jgi:hypothetical protein
MCRSEFLMLIIPITLGFLPWLGICHASEWLNFDAAKTAKPQRTVTGYQIVKEVFEAPFPFNLFMNLDMNQECAQPDTECVTGACHDTTAGSLINPIKIRVLEDKCFHFTHERVEKLKHVFVIGACSSQEALELVSARYPLTVRTERRYGDILQSIAFSSVLIIGLGIALAALAYTFWWDHRYMLWKKFDDYNQFMRTRTELIEAYEHQDFDPDVAARLAAHYRLSQEYIAAARVAARLSKYHQDQNQNEDQPVPAVATPSTAGEAVSAEASEPPAPPPSLSTSSPCRCGAISSSSTSDSSITESVSEKRNPNAKKTEE